MFFFLFLKGFCDENFPTSSTRKEENWIRNQKLDVSIVRIFNFVPVDDDSFLIFSGQTIFVNQPFPFIFSAADQKNTRSILYLLFLSV